MIPREDVLLAAQTAVDAVALYVGLTEGDAERLADDFFDAVVARLRSDPRWASVSPYDLDLLLADERRQLAERLTKLIDGHVPADKLIRSYGAELVELTQRALHTIESPEGLED